MNISLATKILLVSGFSLISSISVSGTKTINGGPGSDTLTISYGSISSLDEFSIDRSGDYTSFTDGDGNIILFKNIATLTIGGNSYVGVYDGIATTGSATLNTSGNYTDPANITASWIPGGTLMQLNFGNNIISSAYYDSSNEKAYMYPYGDGQGSHLSVRALNQIGYDDSSALSIFGTEYNDLIAGQGSSNSAALTINSYAGLDVIDISNHTGADTVDAGTGNDIVHVNSNYDLDTSIDGGAGTDWLIILSGSSGVNYTINSSSTSNFENVRAGSGDDTITGDDNANRLVGWGGADILSGGAGNDELYGYLDQNMQDQQGVSDGIDALYGGAGDDNLYGGAGDDLLDGGTGRDILSGEGASGSYDNGGANGADTFVIRTGDGGATLELADVITDFEDGTDQIGLDGITFNDLTVEQGTGSYSSHVVVKKTSSGEFLTIIQNHTVNNITYLDMVSTSTSAQTLTGSSDGDVILGGSGNDTITSGSGDDIIIGYSGDDSVTINGAGDKTIDGGPGSDTLTISHGSISSLGDFSIGRSGDYTSFTDGDGSKVLFKNIETLTIGGKSYVGVYDGIATTGSATLNTSGNYTDPANITASWIPGGTLMQLNFGNNIISSAYYDSSNEKAYMYPYGDGQGSHLSVRALNQIGYDDSSALSIFGTEYNDLIAGQGSSNSAALTINSYAGLDVIDISNHTGADTVDAGTGNDIVHVNSNYDLDTSIDGGAGTDWLIILSGSSGVNYTINSSSTSNFENVRAGSGDDTITGDDNANRLVGWGGADILSGGAGNDELYGYLDQNMQDQQGVSDGIDALYGGAGDDNLYGGAGDDLLDGGTGRDILSGEGASGSYDNGGANGADTFVIRTGDGGASLELADVITDFEDGDDIIGMSGLNYSDLTIEQGTGSYSSHVVVKKTDSGEFLTIIQNVSLSVVDDDDFSAI
jgi:Ca2+-binding RTX toxin-like protein